MNQSQIQTVHGVLGLALFALVFIGLFHLFGLRVVVTTALRVGRGA